MRYIKLWKLKYLRDGQVKGWAWWCMSLIPATQDVDAGGSQFKVSPAKVCMESV
jgi:hypothetical protein